MDDQVGKLKELFNNVDIGLYRSMLDGRLLEVNPMLVRISGLDSREEVLKHNIIELYPNPEDRKGVVERIKKDGLVKLYSFPIINFKGKKILANVSVTLARGENGEMYLDGAVQDITELEESKSKLAESEMKYRDIVENMDMAVFVSTPGPVGKFIEVNDAAVKLFGADSKEDLLSRAPGDLYADPSERKRVSDGIINDGFAKDLELHLVNYKGDKITVLSSVIFKNDGRGQFFYGTCLDITERKLIEEKLRKNEAALKKSQEVARVGSWNFNLLTGKIVWSEEVFRIFGTEILDRELDLDYFMKFVHPDYVKKVNDVIKHIIGGKIPDPFEYCIVRTDNSIRYIYIVSFREFSDGGKPAALSGIVQDITDRKKIELDLLEKIKELEHMNALMVNRELKMIELKSEISEMKKGQEKINS